MFTMNLFLMLVWVVLSGQYTLGNLLWGFALGYAVMWLVMGAKAPQRDYFQRTGKTLSLGLFFLYEVVKANVRLTKEILTPTHRMRPAIVAVPLDLRSDQGIMLLVALVTLTPGSFTVDLSEDRRVLFVHFMYTESPEEGVREIKEGFEKRVREVLES